MRRVLLVLAVVALLAGGSAQAAGKTVEGVYIGASLGQAAVELSSGSFDIDDDDFAYKIFGGYRAASFFAVEGSWRDLGKVTDSSGLITLSSDTTAFDVEGLGILKVGPVDIFGKIGVVWTDTKVGAGSASSSESDTNALYGLGLNFRIWRVGIRLEYEILDTSIPDDLDMVSLGAQFTF